MAREIITPAAQLGPYADALVKITPVAANVSDKNRVRLNRGIHIIAQNSGGTVHTVTVTSAPDEQGRLNDIGPTTLAAGEFWEFPDFSSTVGWMQTDGYLYFEANHAEVKFLVSQRP